MEACLTFDQAMHEASRCLLCHDAPCSRDCPAGTDPGRFIRKLRFRNLKGAVAVIKENNVLGGSCAVVCPTCDLCAKGCVSCGIGNPIKIGQLQRFLVEWAWDTGFSPLARPPVADGPAVAIVGSGPSGLTCAAELARRGLAPVVFEQQKLAGGMLQWAIPEGRLSRKFLDRELDDVRALGVEIRCSSPIATQKDLDGLFKKGFAAVYVATGAWAGAALDVPSRPAKGTLDAVSFLTMAKHAPRRFQTLVRDKSVAIVGGGDTAMDAATVAEEAGAREVNVVYRRSFREMPGSREEKERAIRSRVAFSVLTQPVDFVVARGKAAGLKVVRTTLGKPDRSGRPRPVPVPGSEHILAADVVVEALGLTPTASIKALSGLESDGRNRVVVGKDGAVMGARRVFAGGDAVRGASLVANAVGDGKTAATSIIKALGL